jgi:hypothetical protein
MGFVTDIKNKSLMTVSDLFAKVRVEDILKFGKSEKKITFGGKY